MARGLSLTNLHLPESVLIVAQVMFRPVGKNQIGNQGFANQIRPGANIGIVRKQSKRRVFGPDQSSIPILWKIIVYSNFVEDTKNKSRLMFAMFGAGTGDEL